MSKAGECQVKGALFFRMLPHFVERGLHLLYRWGMLGAITSHTGFFLSSFQKWREEILLQEARPTVFVDFGYGVLDTAMVETAAYCLEALGREVAL